MSLNPGFGEHPDWTEESQRRLRKSIQARPLAHELMNEYWPLEAPMPRIGGDHQDAKIVISYAEMERILLEVWWRGKED